MTKITIHIGYHKTATTWLQNILFQNSYGFCQVASHSDVFEYVVKLNSLQFQPKAFKALVERNIEEIGPRKAPIISSELLSGHPYDGNRGGDIYALRLKEMFKDARIIISIRSQLRILPSVYMHYLQFGGTMTWREFFEGPTEIEHFGFSPDHFKYDLLVSYYQSLFGADNVLVVPQEDLIKRPDAVCKRIADFSGNYNFKGLAEGATRSQSPSYPEYSAPILRRANFFQRSPLNPRPIIKLGTRPNGPQRIAGYILRSPPFFSVLKGRKPVSEYVKKQYSGYFTDSNFKLAELVDCQLDLSIYD